MTYKIICHRGINRQNENTYNSITGVIDIKQNDYITYGVEFDVQITRDNNIICYHDNTLERLHGDYRRVIDITHEDISAYNLPYFEKVMRTLSSNKNIIIDVELKIYKPYNKTKIHILCRKVLDICASLDITRQCIFTSFNDDILIKLLSFNKCIKVGKLADASYDFKSFGELTRAGISILVLDKKIVLDVIKRYNVIISEVDLYVYTLFSIYDQNVIDDDSLVKKLKEMNIGLITDNYSKMTDIVLTN
ncbi:glycerophosphoryl diester phosphodiesterase [Fadolivirus algeromassiliense]|jgi:glycerophosphoryl diester phosphodiesterase|uniref:Glycerophosphoryl diester phosphodiesterase n=1 Tax=Fadolivirus FV1/VV64 TaxID=3070911 RepID=A0A7D3UUK3_9VIRU|nr:glycerophosphoryl diester phosphodiesterase [Fadolivirus algeromassiliense]QKF93549.1 glycerophosphoryl diester phosphodiesterase [Fadolivirus FV1/VV64]